MTNCEKYVLCYENSSTIINNFTVKYVGFYENMKIRSEVNILQYSSSRSIN